MRGRVKGSGIERGVGRERGSERGRKGGGEGGTEGRREREGWGWGGMGRGSRFERPRAPLPPDVDPPSFHAVRMSLALPHTALQASMYVSSTPSANLREYPSDEYSSRLYGRQSRRDIVCSHIHGGWSFDPIATQALMLLGRALRISQQMLGQN